MTVLSRRWPASRRARDASSPGLFRAGMIERTSDHDVREGRFVLRNRREEIERAQGSVLEMIERRGYGLVESFRRPPGHMAEALANALEHGNRIDPRAKDREAGASYRPVLGGDRRSVCRLRPTGCTRSGEAGEPRHTLWSRYRVDACAHNDRSRFSPAGQPGVHVTYVRRASSCGPKEPKGR